MSCLSARVHTPKYLPFQFLLCPPLGYPRILSISYSTHSSSMALTTHLLFLWFPSLSLPTITSILSSNPMYSNRNWILQNFLEKILYKNLPGISSITSGPLKDFILPYLFPKLETSISNFTYFSTYLTKNNQSPNTGYSIPETPEFNASFPLSLHSCIYLRCFIYFFPNIHSKC